MKYLPIRELEIVASALNFQTPDCRVVGGCDLYITKAASKDKKLYKSIDKSLNSQHESLVHLSESLSTPAARMFNVDLSRKSAFGSLGETSNRRTFAYLIATLNSTHQDYDFSNLLRPSDFCREQHLSTVVRDVDDTLHNLRPKPVSGQYTTSAWSLSSTAGMPQTPGGGMVWSPKMWKIIDKEMVLRDCELYRYSPEEDPFDGEDSAIWSTNYFFFNKLRRRVLYVHFRAMSNPASHSLPSPSPASSLKRHRPVSRRWSHGHSGASKRARFWLGDKADRCASEPVWGEDDDGLDDDYVIWQPDDDDEVDVDDTLDGSYGRGWSAYDEEEDDDEIEMRWREKSSARSISESIVGSLEI